MDQLSLIAAAVVFALVCGMNDGASLVAVAMRGPRIGLFAAILTLVAGVILTPLVVGTAVARTLTVRLVAFGGSDGVGPILVAVAATAIVVGVLARRGLPTSITLALVGSIVGSGIGHGLPIAWGAAGAVLLVALAAPLVGALAAIVIARLSDAVQPRVSRSVRVTGTHVVAFSLLAFAYGANAGQSMIAMWLFAASVDPPASTIEWPHLVVLGALFGVGILIGLPRLGGPFAGGLVVVRPAQAANAELSAAAAVLGSTALGAPVSIIQVLTAALVGTSVKDGPRLVRWKRAARTAGAWYATFPAAVVVALAIALLARYAT